MNDRSQKTLTLDAIYGPEGQVDFDGKHAQNLRWKRDAATYLEKRDDGVYAVAAEDGASECLYTFDDLAGVLVTHDDLSQDDANDVAKQLNPDPQTGNLQIFTRQDALYLLDRDARDVRKLSESNHIAQDGQLSPKGTYAVYYHAGDLYQINLADDSRTQLTTGGSDEIFNGRLSWVYQEEVYGRGNWRAWWWRDDEAYLAYLQLDQTEVPAYTIIDHRTHPPKTQTYRYPKPGEPNPVARLGVLTPGGTETMWIDLSKYADLEWIICRVSWAPNGRLVFQVQDREGTWLDLNTADPQTGQMQTLLRETTEAWVNPHGDPHWLADGSFLWRSERDGYLHVYHYAADGTLIRRITEGSWEVRRLHGVDEEAGALYVTGTRDSWLEEHVYRVDLASGNVARLTELGYSHSANFNDAHDYFIDTYTNVTTPPKVRLHRSDGDAVRFISENNVPVLDAYGLLTPEFVTVPNDRGFMMNGRLIRPANMEPGKKYPVVVETYAGPHGPSVGNRWGGKNYLFHQLLAQSGYVYWMVDAESASGCGAVSAWQCYQRFGQTELADVEASLHWLRENYDFVDLDRVALNGWSYGGFFTSYALTHSKMFKVGIAGASPTDWRLYDSIYTERFMRTPQNNPEGYDKTSVIKAAADLHGQLLLVHGTLDDNVHVQNTLQLVYALQQAGKAFDLMLYPGNQHGIRDNIRHWAQTRFDYIREHL